MLCYNRLSSLHSDTSTAQDVFTKFVVRGDLFSGTIFSPHRGWSQMGAGVQFRSSLREANLIATITITMVQCRRFSYVQGHNTGQCWVGLDLVYSS